MDRFKFRVWDKIRDSYVCDSLYLFLDGKLYGDYQNGIRNENMNNFIIEQSTGLKDKSSKLIYEGDIIEIKTLVKAIDGEETAMYSNEVRKSDIKIPFVVFFDVMQGEYRMKSISKRLNEIRDFAWWVRNGKSEIIGNIHENQKLIKGE